MNAKQNKYIYSTASKLEVHTIYCRIFLKTHLNATKNWGDIPIARIALFTI